MIKKDQTYERLVESQISISKSLEGIHKILEKINDSNITHQTQAMDQHKEMFDLLILMRDKYWWLIIAMLASMLIMFGYPQIASMFV